MHGPLNVKFPNIVVTKTTQSRTQKLQTKKESLKKKTVSISVKQIELSENITAYTNVGENCFKLLS
jgi:hypothetical protein